MGSVEEHRASHHRKRQTSSIEQTSISYTKKIANGALNDSCLTDDEKRGNANDKKSQEQILKERGISLVDSDMRNFANVSPNEVTDYYKGLGDWQNILPKTDYAYSPVSIYNKKKINGIYPVLPNMSRRKLWNNKYEHAEVTDRQTVRTRSEHHSYMSSSRRWFIHHNDPATVDKRYDRAPSYSSSNFNLRQWISSKRSSFLQSSTNLYERWHSYFKKIRTRSALDSSSSSWRKTLVQYVFPFLLLLFLISYLFPWSPFPASSLSPIDYVCKCSSIIYTYVSLVIESLFSLVHHTVDFTLTSGTFNLSCISWPADLSLRMIPNLVFAPIYQVFWSTVTPKEKAESTKSEKVEFHLDDAQIEQLFRRFLEGSSTLELSRKLANSPDFADMMDKKFKDFEERQTRAYEKLLSDHTIFHERLKTLESLMADSKIDEQVEKLREEMEMLKEEIRSKETKIQNDFYNLLFSVLHVEPDKEANFEDLRAKFAAIFRSIEEAHFKVDKLNEEFFNYVNNASDRIEIAVERSGKRIKFDLRSFVDELVVRKVEEWKRASSSTTDQYDRGDALEEYVRRIVQKALDVYDADKTGMADYALESSGGSILSTRCTETKKSQAQFSILGIPFWKTSTSPRTVIQPSANPGECWAFPGSTGYLVIQLSKSIFITGVSLEHIPKAIAQNGTIDSAPKAFSVWALRSETDPEAKLLGTFQYDDNGPSVQSYEVIPLDQPYEIVELKILSNHGKIDYTCLYRFRVHGIPA